MTLTRKGKHWYGSEDDDICAVIQSFSDRNGYLATDYRASVCVCGSTLFRLFDDEEAGVARRDCVSCGKSHLMGDSAEYVDEAELEAHWCLCGMSLWQSILVSRCTPTRAMCAGCTSAAVARTACWWGCMPSGNARRGMRRRF